MNLTKSLFGLIMGKRLPVTNGSIKVIGIKNPVKIGRDKYGISYIEADNAEDAWFGMGFCHGQDRAFQIISNMRVVRGTLSEVVGKSALRIDRLSRRIGFYRSAQEQLETVTDEIRRTFEAYVKGVNEGIGRGLKKLPHEFSFLRMKPYEMNAADVLGSVKLFSYAMAFNWDCEIMRHKILTMDGVEALKALDHSFPDYKLALPPNYPVSGDAVDRLSEDLSALMAVAGKIGGSNNWTIAPSRTATGRPILANDPHVGPALPSYWYYCKVSTPEFTVLGASFAGAPSIISGHNGTCAWGMTAGMSDVVDLFIEEIGPDGRSVKQGDAYVPCEVLKEIIYVKGAEPVEEDVLITPRGPVISPALNGIDTAFSLCAAWLKKTPINGLLSIHKANSFESVQKMCEDWPILPINLVYADKSGNIGWQLIGQVPNRKKGYGTIPQCGWDPETGWTDEYVPLKDMPSAYNPESGFYATANNKPFDNFSNNPFIAVDWVDGYRASRITEMLEKRSDWDVESVMKLQQDILAIPWREIKDIVLSIPQENERVNKAISILSTWDGVTSADSIPASVYEFFMNEMMRRVNYAKAPNSAKWILGEGVDSILPHTYVPMRRMSHLVRLIQEQPHGWFSHSWQEEMADALNAAVDRLTAKHGKNPENWAWGKVRPLTLSHPFGIKYPANKIFNVGPFSWGGDTQTVCQCYVDPLEPDANPSVIDSLRTSIDVGNWDESLFALAGGQSGNPYSPHYSDLFNLLYEGRGFHIPWTKEKEKEAITDTLELVPEK